MAGTPSTVTDETFVLARVRSSVSSGVDLGRDHIQLRRTLQTPKRRSRRRWLPDQVQVICLDVVPAVAQRRIERIPERACTRACGDDGCDRRRGGQARHPSDRRERGDQHGGQDDPTPEARPRSDRAPSLTCCPSGRSPCGGLGEPRGRRPGGSGASGSPPGRRRAPGRRARRHRVPQVRHVDEGEPGVAAPADRVSQVRRIGAGSASREPSSRPRRLSRHRIAPTR